MITGVEHRKHLAKPQNFEMESKIKTISTSELKAKMDGGDLFKLVMTFHEKAFKSKHIPGSINIFSEESAQGLISPSDEIVVYCVNPYCKASINAYLILLKNGFNKVYRYAGGLEEWEKSGYSLEGENVAERVEPDDNFFT